MIVFNIFSKMKLALLNYIYFAEVPTAVVDATVVAVEGSFMLVLDTAVVGAAVVTLMAGDSTVLGFMLTI